MFAMWAGVWFFGLGYDKLRGTKKVWHVWHFLAFVVWLLCLCEALEWFSNLVVITCTLAHLTGAGGSVFYLSHMMHNSDHSEINTAAAFWILYGVGEVVNLLVLVLVSNPVLVVVYVLILVALSWCGF